jgi:hypothetical protein
MKNCVQDGCAESKGGAGFPPLPLGDGRGRGEGISPSGLEHESVLTAKPPIHSSRPHFIGQQMQKGPGARARVYAIMCLSNASCHSQKSIRIKNLVKLPRPGSPRSGIVAELTV